MFKRKKIVGIILARGGSKGLPGKNIISLKGRPLIAWTITAALQSAVFDRVVVSSDDDKILAVANRYGALVVKRPKKLATDRIRPEPAIVHTLEKLRDSDGYIPDIITLLQPTSPLRDAQDIKNAAELMIAKAPEAVVSVLEIDRRLLKSFIPDDSGYLTHFTKAGFMLMRRQDLPPVYFTNGAIYMVEARFFLKTRSLFPKRVLPYVMSQEKSYDVDTKKDLEKIAQLMKNIWKEKF